MCLVLINRTAANSFSDTVQSSDHVAPTRVHWGDSGLSKQAVLGALLRNFPHLVKVFHASSDLVIRQCSTVTQDSSAKQCSSAACQCLPLLSTAPVLWPQWCKPKRAVLKHCSTTGIKFTNVDYITSMLLTHIFQQLWEECSKLIELLNFYFNSFKLQSCQVYEQDLESGYTFSR